LTTRRWLAALALSLLLAAITAQAVTGDTFFLMLGCRTALFDHLPVFQRAGRMYVTTAVLDELGLSAPAASMGQAEAPEGHDTAPGTADPYASADEAGQVRVGVLAVPTQAPARREGRARYRLAGHYLDVSLPGQSAAAELDGAALGTDDVTDYRGRAYLSSAALERAGLYLAYNPQQNLYQLAGLINRVEFETNPPALVLAGLTPLAISGAQRDDTHATFEIQGGFFADTAGREFPGNATLQKYSLKSQPEAGRSYLFIVQPRRTGFKVDSEPKLGFARIRFGNYFQVANYQRSSSGEVSLTVQLGAPCQVRCEMLADPPRLVADFPGVEHRDASQEIAVNQGGLKAIRVGVPEPGLVRVVLDLAGPLDYRLLSDDNGARYYIQLLPAVPQAPAQPGQPANPLRRKGRAIMLDAGHGGSDPGTDGAVADAWEAPLNLALALQVERDLEDLGYTVLQTRTDDRFVSLGERADYANNVLPYLFVSVHCNSIEDPKFQGLMTFHHPKSRSGPRLAALIQEETLKATGAVDKGVRQANFFVLRETVVPSALVECGCMSNREECLLLLDARYQAKLAQGIARGIDRYVQETR
jgi:N-acetylmuramoyl-L-alanine amidase